MCWKNLIASIILLSVVDAPYLYLNSGLYRNKVKQISCGKTLTNRYYSALMVYIALAIGIVFLVLPRITADDNMGKLRESIIYGGIFGFATYATFDFTMHFMFEGWDIMVSVMDTLWGCVLCSSVSFILAVSGF
jgi:uncharacterized membrane protein